MSSGCPYTRKFNQNFHGFAYSKDKKPARRILLLQLGIQIRVMRARNLSGSRRLSTGFFRPVLLPHPEASEPLPYQCPGRMQEFFACFFEAQQPCFPMILP
jgi:hypothetical protein